MVNRDFGRKLIGDLQRLLGFRIVSAKQINSKPDVTRALEKICRGYAKHCLINAGAIDPIKESELELYKSLAVETKKKNEALRKASKNLELKYLKLHNDHLELLKINKKLKDINEQSKAINCIAFWIYLFTMILVISSKWW